MIITCQQCSTSYNLDETLLKPEGTKVRCTICKSIFTAYPPLNTPSQPNVSAMESPQSSSELTASNQTDSLEVPDDIAEVLGRSFDDKEFADDEEINHLPPNMVHEIEEDDEDDLNFDDLNFKEAIEDDGDDFEFSDSTFDLSEGAGNIIPDDEFDPDDIEQLSDDDLDLVGGYQSTNLDFAANQQDEQLQEIHENQPKVESKILYNDGSISLDSDDIDLVGSMTAEALVNDFPSETQDKESATETEHEHLSFAKSSSNDLSNLEDDVDFDEDSNSSQIDIGAELDIEFGSDLADDADEQSPDEDLDMELTLDDSDEDSLQEFGSNESALDIENIQEEEKLEDDFNLDLDFDTEFKSEDILDESNDLDFDFDSELEDIETEENDQDELDLKLDFDESPDDNAIEDIEKPDSSLGIELEDEEGLPELTDDLELTPVDEDDLDFNLELDQNDGSEANAGSAFGEDDLDLGLDIDVDNSENLTEENSNLAIDEDDDLNLSLDFDEGGQDVADNDLDLGLDLEEDNELELDFSDEGKTESKSKEELSFAKEDDFSLDLDLGDSDSEDHSGHTAVEEDEIDLGLDLEGEDNDSLPESEFKLDLDMDDSIEETKIDSVNEGEEEEFDLGLDLEDDESHLDSKDSDDLDLSDLQDLLDTDQEKPKVKAEESDEFDLSDLESVIDNSQDNKEDTAFTGEEELELDLDIESDLAETTVMSSPGKDFSAELDLSEFEYVGDSDEKSPADDHFDTGDMELEFQIEEKTPEPPPPTPAPDIDGKTREMPAPSFSEEEDLQAEDDRMFKNTAFTETMDDDEEDYNDISAPAEKKGISKPLIIALIVVILLGGGYCAFRLLDGMGINIPFISGRINPTAEDPGNLKLATEDINSKFIDNASAGRLFVITGNVRSTYDTPRRFIQMTGKLFTKGKKLAKTEVIYCGNVVSDAELASMDINAIKKRLADRFGEKDGTVIQSGQTLPFMVVFSELPKEQLEEFTIEVDKSAEVN